MDDRRFDQLAKAFAGEVGSRREALGLAISGAAAAVFGFLDAEEAADAQRRNNNDRNRRRRNRRRGDRRVRICHCGDNNPDQVNCNSIRVPEKKADRHLRKHQYDYKGKCNKSSNACTDVNAACQTNQGAACCAGTCCFDVRNPGPTGGVCPPQNANCCGANQSGGYCTSTFPRCCGEDACCRTDEVCCATISRPAGYCCPAGSTCDLENPSGCRAAQTAATQAESESIVGTFEPRGRAGN